MSYFRDMSEPETNDITKHPGYASLDDADRSKVNERYSSVYLARQRFGEKIAQGMAFVAAKQMCEAFNKHDMDESELDEKHMGFKAVQNSIEDKEGYSKERAGAIAASIGRKKYGAKAMASAAKNHHALGETDGYDEEGGEAKGATYEAEKSGVAQLGKALGKGDKHCVGCGVKPKAKGLKFCSDCAAGITSAGYFNPKNMKEDEAMGTADPAPGTDMNEIGYPKPFAKSRRSGFPLAPKWVKDSLQHSDKMKTAVKDLKKAAKADMKEDEDDLVAQAVSHTAKFGSDYGVTQQAHVPQAHPITFDAKASTPPVPHDELPHGTQEDPEDGNAKGMQKKNVLGKDPLATAAMKESNIDPMIMAALGYIDYRAQVSGIMESFDSEVGELVEKFEDIGHGDHVTIRSPHGGNHKGKVVMPSSHGGWVLNMGGRHGTPGIVDASNYVSHRKAAKKKSPGDSFSRDMVRHEKGLTDR